MGMFDTIKDRFYCVFCGQLSREGVYQTKDLSDSCDEWTLKEVIEFFSEDKNTLHKVEIVNHCEFCGKRNEIILNLRYLKEAKK